MTKRQNNDKRNRGDNNNARTTASSFQRNPAETPLSAAEEEATGSRQKLKPSKKKK